MNVDLQHERRVASIGIDSMISIIIPVYNSEAYLSRCLDSLYEQSYQEFQLICINDGSTDHSLAILEQYQQKFHKMLIHTIENHGQAYARNLGITLAEGEFVCFVDSDDACHSDMLLLLTQKQKETNADLVICHSKRIFEYQPSFMEKNFIYEPRYEINTVSHVTERKDIIPKILSGPFCKLIRKQLLVHHDIVFPNGLIYEDLCFTQHILSCNPAIATVKKELCYYYVKKQSSMTDSERINNIYPVFDFIHQYYQENHMANGCSEELAYLMLYHIAIGTTYRLFIHQKLNIFTAIKQTKKYLKTHGVTTYKNRYLSQLPLFARIYLFFYFIV